MGAPARGPVGEAARGGAHRLVAGRDRQLARPRCRGGSKTRLEPGRPLAQRSKHQLIACGRTRRAARRVFHRGEPQRHHPARAQGCGCAECCTAKCQDHACPGHGLLHTREARRSASLLVAEGFTLVLLETLAALVSKEQRSRVVDLPDLRALSAKSAPRLTMERAGIEPATSGLQSRRSPS